MTGTVEKKNGGDGNKILFALLTAGTIGALIGLFALARKRDGIAGEIDRALGVSSLPLPDGGSSAADLGLDQPHHGPTDRAGEDFRPDPTAAIPADRRAAFAPATMPSPAVADPII